MLGAVPGSPVHGLTRSIQRLDCLSYEKKLGELGLFTLEKVQCISLMSIKIRTEGAKTEPGSSQCCPVPGQEALGTNWSTGGSFWAPGALLCNVGDGAQAAQRLWRSPNTPGHGAGRSALGVTVGAGLGLMDTKGTAHLSLCKEHKSILRL